MRDVLIGIDASLINCGVAVLENGTLQLYKGELLEAVAFIRKGGWKDRAYIVIEDPNKDRAVFGMWGKVKASILKFAGKTTGPYGIRQTPGTLPDIESEFRMAMKQAQNVGESKAAAKVLIALFKQAGMPVVRIAPSDRHRADKDGLKVQGVQMLTMPTKTTAAQFEKFTGYTGRSNEHNRDAATLVWGKAPKWCEFMLAKQGGL
jgi:hypothetical protein